MKKRSYLILICVILVALLTSCKNINNERNIEQTTQNRNYEWLPKINGDNEILLYDKFDQRILTYNTDQHEIVQRNDTLNYLQFGFNNLTSDIYTTGHSVENNYKIIKMDEKKISLLYEADKSVALFPLAYKDDENMYFLKSTYLDTGEELYAERVVCSFSEKTKMLTEIANTKGMRITNGVIIEDTLYFTVYNANSDMFELYSLNALNNKLPNLLDENLIAGEIYNNSGELYTSDNSTIYSYQNNAICFPKKLLNYFYYNRLFQIDTNINGDLELFVTNVVTTNLDADIDGIIDVRVFNDKIYIYTNKDIIEMKV